MIALLAAALLAVRPAADAPKLVAEYGQRQPLVVHFFASWCGACREEFPRLRAVLLETRARVLLVSIDQPGMNRAARAMLEEAGLASLPALLLDAPDPAAVVAAMGERKWDGALPATFVFDARARRVQSFVGAASPGALAAAIRRASR